MTNTNAIITTAALIANYFNDDIHSRAELIAYATELPDPTNDLRTELIRMIDLDISDALHNMNLEFFIPLTLLDTLPDDELDALADALLRDTDPAMIADALLAMHPA